MMAVAVAAMSFAACSTDVTEEIAPAQEFTVKINAAAPETRTVFGTLDDGEYPTLWEGNESIKAALNVSTAKSVNIADVSNDGASATFDEVTFTDDASGSYTIYAVSPASAASGLDTQYKSWTIVVPTEQTPTATSCDPAAQILVGKSATTTSVPSEVTMNFNHFTAYAKINFKNVALNGATVESIHISADGKIAGQFYNYPTQNKANNTSYAKTSITVDTKYITVDTNSLANVWVALAPTTVKELTFTINTDQGTITKAVTGLNNEFKSGVVATFNVDMAGKVIEKGDKYTLVTDLSVLAEGDNVIIASAGSDYAIGTDNTGNSRPAVSITKSDNTIIPNNLVGIFTVHDAGTNLYAFKDASNDNAYLYASSSGTYYYLGTQAENDANGHWDITVDSTNGTATVVAQGTNTNNVLHCITAGTSGNIYFGATPSTYTKGHLISLYYKSNGGAKIAIEPQIIASDISNVADTGIENATANIKVRGISGTVTAIPDGTVVTAASVSDNVLTYSVAANNGAAREGSIAISGGNVTITIKVAQIAKPSSNAITVEWASISNTAQNWASETHDTYGSGFGASDENIKLAFYKNNDSNLRDITANTDNHIRVYTKNILIITPLKGKKIKSVVFTTTAADKTVDFTVLSDNNSTAIADSANMKISWSGSVDSFIGKPAAQCRISGIKVVME